MKQIRPASRAADEARRLHAARLVAQRRRQQVAAPEPAPFIRRRSGPVRVECASAPTAERLRALLGQLAAACPGGCAVSDLSLGGWRPHQIAAELAGQLGRPLRSGHYGTRTAAGARSPGDPSAHRVGNWIDDEARGDSAVRSGAETAAEVLAAMGDLPRAFLVIAPRFGLAWRAENESFLHFFAQGVAAAGGRLVLVLADASPPAAPAGLEVEWPEPPARPPDPTGSGAPSRDARGGSLYPGVVPPATAERLLPDAGEAVALPSGYRVVAPEARRPPASADAQGFAELLAGLPPAWLRGFAACFSGAASADGLPRADVLSTAAWNAFRTASTDIAVSLQERAVETSADAAQRAAHTVSLQTMRLILSRFADMASAPDPPSGAPPDLHAQLVKLRAWGCTMSGRATEALSQMETVLDRSGFSEASWVDLYLRNIYALMRFRNGDGDGALALEKEIERQLDARDDEIWHLRYVNCINQARLFRARKDFAASERYFRRAFGITDGVRIPNDAFYAPLCWAGLWEAAGRPVEAFRSRLRAALHWLANPLPEAMAWRFAIAALGARDHRTPWTPEDISRALLASLEDAAAAAGCAGGAHAGDAGEPPPVVHASLVGPDVLAASRGVGAPGWGVLLAPGRLDMPFRGPAHDRLRAGVVRLLREACPAVEGRGATLVVDDQLGRDLPTTAAELVAVCLRHGSGEAVFGDRSIALAGERREAWLGAAVARPGPAVAAVDGEGFVHFKRHLPTRRLGPVERELLERARRGDTLAALAEGRSLEPVARRVLRLVRDHVLTLEVPDA